MVVARRELIDTARRLAFFTVGWNVIEGLVATVAAVMAGSQALLGFGLDSAVESLSGVIVIWRLGVERRDPERAESVEQRALRLIGITFFLLAGYIAVAAVGSLVGQERPEVSGVGIVLTAVSLVVMPWLARRKRRVAHEMGSAAVEADSTQTWACASLSAVVLGGLVLNALFGWWWADPVAALVVAVLLVREGHEALTAERADECCP